MWLLLLCFLLSHAHEGHDHHHDHAPGDGHEHVLTLDSSNFDTTVNGADLTLVEFYAPWCGHCQRLAPEYEAAASELFDQIPLGKVDCTVEKDLCTKYAVQGFPTLKLFRKDGSITEYNSGRTAAEIVKFLKSQAAPAFSVVESAEALAEFKAADSINVVGYLSETSSVAEVFKAVANALRGEATFAIATPELAKAEGVSVPSVHVYKKFDDQHVTHTGELDAASLTKFVKAESLPVFGEIGPENYQAYVQQGFPLLWAFLDFADEKNSEVEAVIAAVAKQFKQKVSFVKLDGKKWAAHAKNFGISEPFPGIVIEDREKRKNYVFTGDLTDEVALAEHVRGFVQGTLAPTVKSQEPPLNNDEPVKVIVGKTFETIVNDASKDVLVEFYAPWCGHCKTLAPKYEELGKEFKDEPTIVIAKVDATENDTPADIKGFPTLIFYPANNKENPLTYKGERSTKALSDFIRENAVTLKKPKKDEL